ncbi:5-oxoprolinase (ATP-hydrolyzing) [Halorhabdus utahensis DSM 12940]|uniref:5-oxoprolinase (ATP-hydrolyzing) n=1 Tax=Halorhabdus utahensis (strain DSM 12940 / JCM 11049 / AX-2) TaxID=519442 RepID=C7NMD9_HALUD|nr:hydantoinase/oxoprolinase family protein [Halorhabdus utahensis]ACV12578.1 5-oxoprolinase (ATP-hydrolyzing) [Halorhabdus utahensis DSM 12940]
MSAGERTWLGVDVGGTFTDVVLVADGELTTAKVPTTTEQSEGVLTGIETACDSAGLDFAAVDRFRHATTAAVNATLESEGAKTALITTAGFGDVLEIGRQDRPSLYDLDARNPEPLVPAELRFEIDERVTPEGVERAVDPDAVRTLAASIPEDVESVAVCLLHAYAHPDNERTVASVLQEAGDWSVSTSHEVLGTFREYERTATTVADAYVTPVIDAYLGRLTERAHEQGLPAPRVMQSNGGIADAATVREHAVTTLLSGPAAGVVGAASVAGEDQLVTFDMGGTSADVGLVTDGTAARTTDATIAERPVGVPMVDVETVGAGGGSVGWVDEGGALRVGPKSAGADPGPACYGRGGTEPTVTDAALQLGYLGGESFGEFDLDADAAEAALTELAAAADLDGPVAAARGIYRVANATMTRTIRSATVERGHDPREFALVAFGGAGPMHAAALADRLGIERVLVPAASGVLSAYGLLAADETHDAARTHRTQLGSAGVATIESKYDDLDASVRSAASDADLATIEREADLRYAGQRYEVTVPATAPFDPAAMRDRFGAAHERVRGYRLDDEPVELVTLRTSATIPGENPPLPGVETADSRPGVRSVSFEGMFRETPVYDRAGLAAGTSLDGPAIVAGAESTVVVPPGWRSTTDQGTLVLEGGVA